MATGRGNPKKGGSIKKGGSEGFEQFSSSFIVSFPKLTV